MKESIQDLINHEIIRKSKVRDKYSYLDNESIW